VVANADGSYTYDPTAAPDLQALSEGESKLDSFSYTVIDLAGATDTAWVNIEVTGIDDVQLAGLFSDDDDAREFVDDEQVADQYDSDTLYDALKGNDNVMLPANAEAAATWRYNPNRVFSGGAGNDTIIGGALDDRIAGGPDGDALFGGDGDDVLEGGAGADWLDGGSGNDRLDGGADGDFLWGGDGDDAIYGGADNDFLDGGEGDDVLEGGAGGDFLQGGRGDDVLDGGSDNAGEALEPDDVALYDGQRSDYHFTRSGDWILVTDLNSRKQDLVDEGSDKLRNIEQVQFLVGGGVANLVLGGDAAEIVSGTETDDYLFAGAGDDKIVAGEGDDVMIWSPGDGDDEVFGDGEMGGNGSDELQLNLPADDAESITVTQNGVVMVRGTVTETGDFELTLHDVEKLTVWGEDSQLILEISLEQLLSQAANQEVSFRFAELSEMYAEQQALDPATTDGDFLI
jgi:VCBS repeat-containing protein